MSTNGQPQLLSDDENGIQFIGYRRNGSGTQTTLNEDGIAYMGYNINDTKKRKASQALHAPPSKRRASSPEVISLISDDEDPPPREDPSRRQQAIASTTSTSADTVSLSAQRKTSRLCAQGSTSVSTDEQEDEDNYAAWIAALHLNDSQNWLEPHWSPKLNINQDDLHDQVSGIAQSSAERVSGHTRHRIRGLQNQQGVFDWSKPLERSSSKSQHTFAKCFQAAYSQSPGARYIPRRPLGHPRPLRSAYNCETQVLRTIHQAPGDINTIVQRGSLVIIASVVEGGGSGDIPGPYNREGSLCVWNQSHAHILDKHSAQGLPLLGVEQRHHYTVNDVAIDPSCPTKFASAGRDHNVFLWRCDPLDGGSVPELVIEAAFDEVPEVVKYHPEGSLLAVQCNNGSVYFMNDGGIDRCFTVAPPERRHITADMVWGLGLTHRLIFASSACSNDGSGFHKAYDLERHKVVMQFDAEQQACTTLALDPLGERLYIATEVSKSSYYLRQYDVRHRSHTNKAEQQVALEPFVGASDTDVNILSVSCDGIYIAAGRMDNWVDVYDTRMLQRGPIHTFSHEGGGPNTYGVVKTQWVDGFPYGFGLVSGGVDGCVRLWDVKRASDDPTNGRILAQGDYDVATFSLGDTYKGEVPIIVGERSGKVVLFGHKVSPR